MTSKDIKTQVFKLSADETRVILEALAATDGIPSDSRNYSLGGLPDRIPGEEVYKK